MKTMKELPWDQDLYQRLDALCSIGAKDEACERCAQVLEQIKRVWGGTEQFRKMKSKLANVWNRIREEHHITTKL